MAGRKPIVSARQMKARVQIILRATDKDVEQNSEKNRLIDMIESMKEAGVLQEFLLDALKSKLRQDEGQSVVAYRMAEGGYQAFPQRLDSQINNPAQARQVPEMPNRAYTVEPKDSAVAPEALALLPILPEQFSNHVQDEAVVIEAKPAGHEVHPSTIIENVVRGIESDTPDVNANYQAQAPTERRRPRGNLLGAMG